MLKEVEHVENKALEYISSALIIISFITGLGVALKSLKEHMENRKNSNDVQSPDLSD